MRFLLLFFVCIQISACSTVIIRYDGPDYGTFMPAVKNDISAFKRAKDGWDNAPPWMIRTGAVLDIPFSIVTDVCLLPVDLVVMGVTAIKSDNDE